MLHWMSQKISHRITSIECCIAQSTNGSFSELTLAVGVEVAAGNHNFNSHDDKVSSLLYAKVIKILTCQDCDFLTTTCWKLEASSSWLLRLWLPATISISTVSVSLLKELLILHAIQHSIDVILCDIFCDIQWSILQSHDLYKIYEIKRSWVSKIISEKTVFCSILAYFLSRQ